MFSSILIILFKHASFFFFHFALQTFEQNIQSAFFPFFFFSLSFKFAFAADYKYYLSKMDDLFA